MKMKLRKLMQQAASYIEIVLSAFLLMVIIFLAGEFIVESVMGIGYDNATLEYFLEKVMTFAIGVEFVKHAFALILRVRLLKFCFLLFQDR